MRMTKSCNCVSIISKPIRSVGIITVKQIKESYHKE